jgi:5-deoxy-glucuronate isomerase
MSGAMKEVLLEPADHRLGVMRTRGDVVHQVGEAIAWVLVESGEGRLTVNGETADVGGRAGMFDGPGWSAVAPSGSTIAIEGTVTATIVFRPGSFNGDGHIIDPADVADENRGRGPDARRVRTYLAEGPLIAGETVNPPGGWSSYPPHRHEHEEVYVYRFDPANGFGVAMNYDDDRSDATIVRDGHVQRIASGYHPVVAAPGYAMCYLWALAGERTTLTPFYDPVHAWLASAPGSGDTAAAAGSGDTASAAGSGDTA